MATAPAVMERTMQNSSLKAYGKLQGGVAKEDMTEEQKALAFNARISENYRKLINPEYGKQEEAYAEPAPAEPAYRASSSLFASSAAAAAPVYEQPRVADVFRSASALNTKTVDFSAMPSAPVREFEQEAPYREYEAEAPYYDEAQGYAEDVADADLMPTETTTQYRDNLYPEERKAVAVEEKKKGFALTTRNKFLIAVYSIVVVAILALIIVNTSVLNSLDNTIAMRETELGAIVEEAQTLEADINYYTDPATIIERAESELGMYMPGV